MTSRRAFCRHAFSTVAVAAVIGLFAGCSYLLPVRKGTARSYEIVIDSRRVPSPNLSGCYIPAVFPAVTKLPIIFLSKIPDGAKFTGVKVDVTLKNDGGDPLVVLKPVIEDNRVYLEFAVGKAEAFTIVHAYVTAKYDFR